MTLLDLLKRNEALWPNPEASTGIFYRQMGRSCCWEAVGPAREVFIQIADEIKSHLEKSSDPVSHTVTWTIYMIGRTRQRAKPTIMFCCQAPGPRKSVRKMIEASGILGKYPGVVTGDSTRPPDFDQLVPLADLEGTEYPYLSMAEMKKCVLYEPSMDVCGVPIYVKDDKVPGASLRKATIGGVLRAGLKYYCLTVGHAFTDNIHVPFLDSEIELEFEFDLDGQSDTDEDDIEMVDTTSRGSESPEYTPSLNSQSSNLSVDTSTGWSSQTDQFIEDSRSLDFTRDGWVAGNIGSSFSSALESSTMRRDIPRNLRDIGIFSMLSSLNGSRPGLDYALIETDQPEFDTFNRLNSMGSSRQYLLDPEQIVLTRPSHNTKVLAATAFNGVMEGTISGTPAFMRVPFSTTFQEVWTVRLLGKLTAGDCGSWVVNLESGDVYGHIIAGSTRSGVVYIVPAYEVHADLKARSGLDFRLSIRNSKRNKRGDGKMPVEDSSDKDSMLDMSTSDRSQNPYPSPFSGTSFLLGPRIRGSGSGTGSGSTYQSLRSFGQHSYASSVATSHPNSLSLDYESLRGQAEDSPSAPDTTAVSCGSSASVDPMNRSRELIFSMESSRSTLSYLGQTYAASPLLSFGSSPFEEGSKDLGSYIGQSPSLPPQITAVSQGSSAGLPLFHIERDGDPNIMWFMYYDFTVTDTEAYYQLQPGYLPTNKYPSRIMSERVMIDGEKRHLCRIPDCKAAPFTRHYDLRRHFLICHQVGKEQGEKKQMNCDYKKCIHIEPFRKDHCREHYREYHSEDLIRRGQSKNSKPKHGKKKPDTVEEFLASRIKTINLSWWRCSKCLQRVHVNPNGYKCPTCNLACESERVTCRENARNSANNNSGNSSAQTNQGLIGCGQCENTWLPDGNDDSLWVSCPKCRPGIRETMQSG